MHTAIPMAQSENAAAETYVRLVLALGQHSDAAQPGRGHRRDDLRRAVLAEVIAATDRDPRRPGRHVSDAGVELAALSPFGVEAPILGRCIDPTGADDPGARSWASA